MQELENLTLPSVQSNKTRQALLESLLNLTIELHALDQNHQPSDIVERQLQRVHGELSSNVKFGQQFQVTRGGQIYLVSLSPVGVTYQPQHPLDGVRQATA